MSPAAALFMSCMALASNLVISRVMPLSVTLTFCRPTSWKIVAKFFDPFGRPFGLPDCPFRNCRLFGGFAYPVSYRRSDMDHPPVACNLCIGLARLDVDG